MTQTQPDVLVDEDMAALLEGYKQVIDKALGKNLSDAAFGVHTPGCGDEAFMVPTPNCGDEEFTQGRLK